MINSFSFAPCISFPSKLHDKKGSGFPWKSTESLNDSPTLTFASSGFFMNFGDTNGGDIFNLLYGPLALSNDGQMNAFSMF